MNQRCSLARIGTLATMNIRMLGDGVEICISEPPPSTSVTNGPFGAVNTRLMANLSSLPKVEIHGMV